MRKIDADALIDWLEDHSPLNWTDSDAEIQAVADWEQFKAIVNAMPTIKEESD